MKTRMTTILILILTISISAFSQNEYLFMPQTIAKTYLNKTRSIDGKPGANYWQNSAKYDIKAEFFPETKQLLGQENIVYFNNSPDSLRYLVIKLKQNLYKKGVAKDYNLANALSDGVNIKTIKVNGTEYDVNNRREIMIYGTIMYVILDL